VEDAGIPGARTAEALSRLMQVLLGALGTRGALLVTEVEEARAHLEARALWFAVAGVAGFVVALLGTLLWVVAWWDTHRMEALAAALGAWGALGVGAAWRAVALGRAAPPLLGASLAALREDRRALAEGRLARRVADAADAAEVP
jgi:uncharacterized membrane protein YqjE